MNENRRQILNMLAASKITAEEAERLLAALEVQPGTASAGIPAPRATDDGSPAESLKAHAKYLRVLVEAADGRQGAKAPVTVNIRVPIKLLRAGVRLASLIPAQAHQHLDEAFSRHGVPFTLSQIRPENLEELVDHLEDLTVDIAANETNANVKVKVFSE